MALKTAAVSVSSTATRLDTNIDADTETGQNVSLYNAGAVTVYIGGPNVATTTGIPLVAGAYADLPNLRPGSTLYGIVASGTCEVRVLQDGV